MVKLKAHSPILKIISNSLVELPSPANLNSMWNFGSILGLCLSIQILSGLFLAMHYSNSVELAFESISHINRDVNYGWLLRLMHANGASFFFIFIYLHIGRGLYFFSFNQNKTTWIQGVLILFLVMAAAFLGYVLPWGQMSFWGATVITNLFSAIPILGEDLVKWMWGGFSVGNPTLTRFFALHFIIPFIVLGMVMIHLVFLHSTGSSNPLGLNSNFDKISFHPYFSSKDLFGFVVVLMVLNLVCLIYPWDMGDPENFIPANPLVTPPHIQPEWYFLLAYAILRSIPNKLGGVIALVMSILVLLVCPFLPVPKFKGLTFYPINKFLFWIHINTIMILTWIGARPVEDPYVVIGQLFSVIYFSYYFLQPMVMKLWDKLF